MTRTLLTLLAAVVGSLTLGTFALFVLPFERSGRWLKRLQDAWGRMILAAAGSRVAGVDGLEHLDPARSYLFVSNHSSLLDIPALFSALPRPIVMAAKKELFRIPLLGWMMRAAGFPRIDRSDPDQARAALARTAERLRGSGKSVVLFPEGTRSASGAVGPFKKGAFWVARDLGIEMVPVALAGTGTALPKHSLRVRPATVRLRIGPPVAVAGLGDEQRDPVMEELRAWVAAELRALEGALGEQAPRTVSPG